jgi:hypothetical protein
MKMLGPEMYKLTFDAKGYAVVCQKGTTKFSGLACSKLPKLYIISADGSILYVGITKQRLSARLRLGFSAAGQTGYYGYAWRHKFTKAMLTVWAHEDAPGEDSVRDIETVEAEVVFLARTHLREWPLGQTEIHFHQSTHMHRRVAEKIWKELSTRSGDPKSEH